MVAHASLILRMGSAHYHLAECPSRWAEFRADYVRAHVETGREFVWARGALTLRDSGTVTIDDQLVATLVESVCFDGAEAMLADRQYSLDLGDDQGARWLVMTPQEGVLARVTMSDQDSCDFLIEEIVPALIGVAYSYVSLIERLQSEGLRDPTHRFYSERWAAFQNVLTRAGFGAQAR